MKGKLLISGIAGLVTLAGAAGIALAQSGNSPAPHMMVEVGAGGNGQLVGSIASVSGTTLTVNSWGGVWTVDASHAHIAQRFGGTTTLGNFDVGDQVTVSGTFASNGWAVTARAVRDDSLQSRNISPSGTISGATSAGFTLTTYGGKTYQVTLAATSSVMLNGNAASLANLQNGMRVRVWGMLDRTQSTITAGRVNARTVVSGSGGTSANVNTNTSVNTSAGGTGASVNGNVGVGLGHY